MRFGGLKRIVITALSVAIVVAHTSIPFLAKCAYANTNRQHIRIDSKDVSFWSGGLHFKDINFHDFSNSTVLAFGISGEVEQEDGEDVEYLSEVSYYNKNNEVVAVSKTQQKAYSEKSQPSC